MLLRLVMEVEVFLIRVFLSTSHFTEQFQNTDLVVFWSLSYDQLTPSIQGDVVILSYERRFALPS